MSEVIDIRKLRKPVPNSEVANSGKKNFFDFLNVEIQFKKSVSDRFKEGIYTELNVLFEAGVDIHSALELMQAEYKKSQKVILGNILEKVLHGHSLSEALRTTNGFTAYEYQSIAIGEETGEMEKVLKELASFFNKRIKQRRQIISALTYPIVVLSVAAGAIGFMLAYVVPMFSDIYKRSGDDLPGITKAVIRLSSIVKSYASFSLFLIVIVIVISIWQNDKKWFRHYSSFLLIRVPIWGRLVQKIYLARFASTMGMLLGAKIPMLQAIQLVKQIIRFYPYEEALWRVEEDIISGKGLYQSLSVHSVFPSKMVVMIKVGEEVNELEGFFKKLSEQFSGEVEYQTTMLGKFIEPLIIVVLGCIVGVVLIAMYLPLFKLGQQF